MARAFQWAQTLQMLERGRIERFLQDGRWQEQSSRARATGLATYSAACRACEAADQWPKSLELLPKMLSGTDFPCPFMRLACAFHGFSMVFVAFLETSGDASRKVPWSPTL